MTDFSIPIEDVAGREVGKGKTKKEIFVDKLKGATRCNILSVPIGSTFTVCNETTQHIHSTSKATDKEWYVWGTAFDKLQIMETYELEIFLTDELDSVFKSSDSNKVLRIMDSIGCIEWR
jgi:hypothetical protein